MFLFIAGIILVLVAVGSAFLVHTREKGLKWGLVGTAFVLGVLGIVFSMITVVGTNKIAIVTSLNKPVDTYAAGWHGKAPWEDTTELDGTRQTLRFEGKGNDKEDGADDKVWPCFTIKIENNATACVSGIAAWQMKVDSKDPEELEKQKEKARQLFLNYRTFPRIIRDYIRPSTQSAIQATYNDVNPLIQEKNPSYATLSSEMKTELQTILGVEIDVLFVQITNADWDVKTDEAISLQQDQISKTTQAQEKERTNKAEAAAAEALTKTPDGKLLTPPDDNVLKNKCLDIARDQGTPPGPCLNPGYGAILGPPQPK